MSEPRLLHATAWGQVWAQPAEAGPPLWVAELSATDDVDTALALCTSWLDVQHPSFAPLVEATVEPRAGGRVLRVAHESLRGTSLHELVPKVPPMSEQALAMLLADVARGLLLVHEAGLVAGNVAPETLALCPPGLDDTAAVRLHTPGFVAMAMAALGPLGDADTAKARAVLPKPEAVAPEVLAGQPPTAAADTWGLCATGVFCLLRRHVFAAPQAGLVRQQALRGLEPLDLQELLSLAPTLGPLLARGLAAQPWGRAGVLAELADACGRLLAGRPTRMRHGAALVQPWSVGSPLVPLAAYAHSQWWTDRTPAVATAPTATQPQSEREADQQAQLRAALQRLDLERLASRRRTTKGERSVLSYVLVMVAFLLIAGAIVALGLRQTRRFDDALQAARPSRPMPPPKPLPPPKPRPPEVIFEQQPEH